MSEQIFKKSDFASLRAFEALGVSKIESAAAKEAVLLGLKENAKTVGIPARSFKVMYDEYVRQTRKPIKAGDIEIPGGYSIEPWYMDDSGQIFKALGERTIVACSHPIYINRKLDNIITGEKKVELAFSRDIGETWEHVIVNKSVLSSTSTITELNEYGISVTSSNARNMVTYLQNFEDNNFSQIPKCLSVNRFGWINDYDFSPYAEDDGILFDSHESFNEIRDSLNPSGKYETWLQVAKKVRRESNLEAKIVLSTSFASALVGPLGVLPFFLHLWGGTGTGKTAALMLAASVWADPQIGKFAKTFNSTVVGQETIAGTLYSMPLILDELQSINDRKDFDKMLYELTEGTGRARGTAVGGLRPTLTWRNCMITSGEQPITRTLSGGGAKNRIIEISCDRAIFEDPIEMLETIKLNYAHAGKEWVTALVPEVVKEARKYRINAFAQLVKAGYTEKQSMSASAILTADYYAGQLIFGDEGSFTIDDISQYLLTADEVSKEKQSYEWLRGWIVQNDLKFGALGTETYGKNLEHGKTAIISNVLREACENAGISLEALTSYMDRNGKLERDPKGKRSKNVKIDNRSVRCYVVLPEFDDD